MNEEINRLAKLHAKLIQYIDDDDDDDLWKRIPFGPIGKELFDIANHVDWYLMEIVEKGFVEANEFSDIEKNDIIEMFQDVMSNKGTNANKFWAPFVKKNYKLIDKITMKLFSIQKSINFLPSRSCKSQKCGKVSL